MKAIYYTPYGWWVLFAGTLLVSAYPEGVADNVVAAVPLLPVLSKLSGTYNRLVPELRPGFIDWTALAWHLFRDVAALLDQPASVLRLGCISLVLLIRKITGWVRSCTA